MDTLHNKTAFITGGTKGIGLGVVEALLKQGMRVAFTGRSQESVNQALEKLANLTSEKDRVFGFPADAGVYKEQEAAFKQAVDVLGKIDVVMANAGLGHFAPVDELSVEKWNDTIATNLSGVFYTLKAALGELQSNKGYFLVTSSLAGTNFFKGGSAYNASKFGVTGFAQAAMLDMRDWGIKTSVIMPGSVATHFNGNTPDESDSWKIQKEDIGELVVDLLKMN